MSERRDSKGLLSKMCSLLVSCGYGQGNDLTKCVRIYCGREAGEWQTFEVLDQVGWVSLGGQYMSGWPTILCNQHIDSAHDRWTSESDIDPHAHSVIDDFLHHIEVSKGIAPQAIT